jgi:hypothetical protein
MRDTSSERVKQKSEIAFSLPKEVSPTSLLAIAEEYQGDTVDTKVDKTVTRKIEVSTEPKVECFQVKSSLWEIPLIPVGKEAPAMLVTFGKLGLYAEDRRAWSLESLRYVLPVCVSFLGIPKFILTFDYKERELLDQQFFITVSTAVMLVDNKLVGKKASASQVAQMILGEYEREAVMSGVNARRVRAETTKRSQETLRILSEFFNAE